MRQAVLVVLALLAAGCGGADSGADETFTYDETAPLAVERGAPLERDDALDVRETTYASGDGRVQGLLVTQPGPAKPVPGVVYLHGAGGDREQLLPLAARLAEDR